MTRPSLDEAMLATAAVWAQRSTCSRLAVGAVLARDGRVLSTGYNGAPAGLPHCVHEDPSTDHDRSPVCASCRGGHHMQCHVRECPCCRAWGLRKPGQPVQIARSPTEGCQVAVHAEANALLFAGRHGASTLDTTMYCTHAPCLGCSGLLLNAGVARVVYRKWYRSDDGLERLAAAGVKVQQHG